MKDQELLLELMNQFLERQIDAMTFCFRFIELWTRSRDANYIKKLTWSKPYDEELIAALQRGEITKEQFSKQYEALWGHEHFSPLQDMIDTIHSACYSFRPIPTCSWEPDEDQLRQEVARELTSYQSGLTPP